MIIANLVIALLVWVVFISWIYMLVHMIRNTRITRYRKASWVFWFLFLFYGGAILYYFIDYKKAA